MQSQSTAFYGHCRHAQPELSWLRPQTPPHVCVPLAAGLDVYQSVPHRWLDRQPEDLVDNIHHLTLLNTVLGPDQ